ALVLDLEARARRERHREPAVEAPSVLRTHLERQRREVPAEPEADAEEIAERYLDRRRRLAVPEGAEDREAELVRLLGQRHHRQPEVTHAARARDLAEDVRRPGRDRDAVEVAAAAVPRREPAARDVAQPREIGERPGTERHGAAVARTAARAQPTT